MSKYFSYFPKTNQDLKNNGTPTKVTNILRRFKFRSKVLERSDVFYEYDIQAGDRPDTIAEKYYGDARYAWVVLHVNEIVDPIFDWPLFDPEFVSFIKGKYGSVPEAKAEVHEYRQILNDSKTLYDGTRLKKRYVVIDKDTYDTLAESKKELVTKYDFELEHNEAKKSIKLLDKRFLSEVESEVETILRNGA